MKVVIRYSSRTDIFDAKDFLEREGVEHSLDNVEMDLEIAGLSSIIKQPGEFDLSIDGTDIGTIPGNGARIAQAETE